MQDRVLIRRVDRERKTAGGIFVPDTARQCQRQNQEKDNDNVYFIDEQSFERFQEMVRCSST